MLLYEADYHLGSARLHLARGSKVQARGDLEAARKIVTGTEYHRRDPELEALERMLVGG
jgi:hypothetical protein